MNDDRFIGSLVIAAVVAAGVVALLVASPFIALLLALFLPIVKS